MSTPYAGNAANYPATIALPDDNTDGRDAASVDVPFEGLADRTANLASYVKPAAAFTRVQKGAVVFDSAAWSTNGDGELTDVVNTGSFLSVPLDLPHGATLTAVRAYINPASHAALPAHMPRLQVDKVNVATGAIVFVASATDSSASTAAFGAHHEVSITGASEVVDTETYRYVAWISSEWGSDAEVGLKYVGMKTTCTVATVDPAAS